MAKLKDTMRVEAWMAPGVQLALLDTGVRSIMLYAVGVWSGCMGGGGAGPGGRQEETIRKLQVLYNNCLRQALGG